MKKPAPVESVSALIDERIMELGDWRGKTLAKVREIIHEADPEIVEEWKWSIPVFSHAGIVCTGETYKKAVKLTFAKGAALQDLSGLFNSSLGGNIRRAIDIHEGEKINEPALKDLIRDAVALNLHLKSKTKPKRAASAPANDRQAPRLVPFPTLFAATSAPAGVSDSVFLVGGDLVVRNWNGGWPPR